MWPEIPMVWYDMATLEVMGRMATLEVIHNDRLIDFEGEKKSFYNVLNKLPDHWLNVLLPNQIIGFFDHQYLWKERISILDFLHRNSCQKHSILQYCCWLRVAICAQLCPDFSKPVWSWLWFVWRLHSLIKKLVRMED